MLPTISALNGKINNKPNKRTIPKSKKIVELLGTTIFLLFSIVVLFGLLLIFPFKALIIGCVFYLFLIPVSAIHFLKLKKDFKNESKLNDQEPEDVL